MLFAGMMALADAAVVDHARSVCRQSKGSGPGLVPLSMRPRSRGGGGGWHQAMELVCLPLAAPIGLSPLLILTLCGSERVLVVSTAPLDDLSCLTTPGVGRPGDGLVPMPLTRCIRMHAPSPCGVADSSTDSCALVCASAGSFS